MTPAETAELLERFYEALVRIDADTMRSLYAPTARFEDPVFRLEGAEIGRMWKGLLGRAEDFTATYMIRQYGSGHGTVEWRAEYLFAGKNPVVNLIRSELRMKEGLIIEHHDHFDFASWAAQALGTKGRLFGGFDWFRRAVSRQAAKPLDVRPKP